MTRFGGGSNNVGGGASISSSQLGNLQQQALLLDSEVNSLKAEIPADVWGMWDFMALAGGTTSVKNLVQGGLRQNIVTGNSEFDLAADLTGGLAVAAIATGSQVFDPIQHLGLSAGVYFPGNGAANVRGSIIGTYLNSSTAYNFSVYVRFLDGHTPTTGAVAYANSPVKIYCFDTTTPTNMQVDGTAVAGIYRYSCTFTTGLDIHNGSNFRDYIRIEQSTTVSGHAFTVSGFQVTAGSALQFYERTPYLDVTLTGSPTLGTRGVRFSGGTQYGVTPAMPFVSIGGPWTALFVGQFRSVDTARASVAMSGGGKTVWIHSASSSVVFSQSDTNVTQSGSASLVTVPPLPESSMIEFSLVDVLRMNGLAKTTNNAFSGRATLNIGSFASGGTPIDDFEISYVLLFKRALTDQERLSCYRWLANYLNPKGVMFNSSKPPVTAALPQSGSNSLPIMGWDSFMPYVFATSDTIVRRNAAAVYNNGMRAAGYRYVINSAGWEPSSGTRRDAAGNILWDSTKFPNGIEPLVDYVHGMGFKYGGYTSLAVGYDSFGYTGSGGFVEQDMIQFADWGWDWLQYDITYRRNINGVNSVYSAEGMWTDDHIKGIFHDAAVAIRKTGRAIHLNAGYGAPYIGAAGKNLGIDSIRYGGDNVGGASASAYMMGLFTYFDTHDTPTFASQYTSGYFADNDCLTVGCGLTDVEGRTQFSIYSILMFPLVASAELDPTAMLTDPAAGYNGTTKTPAATIATLTNADVIAVDQDTDCVCGIRVAHDAGNTTDVWARPLSDGSWAILFVNRAATAKSMTVAWSDIATAVDSAITTVEAAYAAGTGNIETYPEFTFDVTPPSSGKNLWTGAAISAATLATGYDAGSIASHACVMIRIYP